MYSFTFRTFLFQFVKDFMKLVVCKFEHSLSGPANNVYLINRCWKIIIFIFEPCFGHKITCTIVLPPVFLGWDNMMEGAGGAISDNCLRYNWFLPEIYMRYAWDIPDVYQRCSWDMHEIYLRYIWDILKISMKYNWDVCEIYRRYTLDMT